MEEIYTEQDWKLFRSRIARWQEAYMERLVAEYTALLTGEGRASDKFWELEKRLRGDREKAGVCVDMRRSKLVWNLVALMQEGAIASEDLEGFSERVRLTVEHFAKA